ncbi:MAG: hypothetical protein IJA92_05705 [Oscillospiraceae bacterium]|nr:hypothetical protein [Oscillospiraceae bacterium]
MKTKLLIVGTVILAALIIAAAIYVWYIGRMSILDKWGMVYEEPSVTEEEKMP